MTRTKNEPTFVTANIGPAQRNNTIYSISPQNENVKQILEEANAILDAICNKPEKSRLRLRLEEALGPIDDSTWATLLRYSICVLNMNSADWREEDLFRTMKSYWYGKPELSFCSRAE